MGERWEYGELWWWELLTFKSKETELSLSSIFQTKSICFQLPSKIPQTHTIVMQIISDWFFFSYFLKQSQSLIALWVLPTLPSAYRLEYWGWECMCRTRSFLGRCPISWQINSFTSTPTGAPDFCFRPIVHVQYNLFSCSFLHFVFPGEGWYRVFLWNAITPARSFQN